MMARRLLFRTCTGVLLVACLNCGKLPLEAGEFRVDTRVFRGGEDRPLTSMTSWILLMRAYDQQQGESGQVTILDSE